MQDREFEPQTLHRFILRGEFLTRKKKIINDALRVIHYDLLKKINYVLEKK